MSRGINEGLEYVGKLNYAVDWWWGDTNCKREFEQQSPAEGRGFYIMAKATEILCKNFIYKLL